MYSYTVSRDNRVRRTRAWCPILRFKVLTRGLEDEHCNGRAVLSMGFRLFAEVERHRTKLVLPVLLQGRFLRLQGRARTSQFSHEKTLFSNN